MKNKLVISILFLGFFAQTHLYGQTSIEISGTIMSPRGPEPGVQVELYNSNGSFITTCLTDINGKFKTIRKLNVGQTVQIRINKKEFQPFEQTYRIDKTGNAGELMLERRKIAISGFVKDSVHNEPPLQGVEVFFYDDSKLIQSKSTNSQGYFVIETDFNYGQKITVRFSKKDFFSKEQTLIITSEGMNRMDDIKLPALDIRGWKVYARVKDRKNGNPISGASIRYYDKKTSSKVGVNTPNNGEVELRIFQYPGSQLDLELSKPKYKEIKYKATLHNDQNSKNEFEIYMDKEGGFQLCPCLFWGGVASALASGGLFGVSESKYKSYKDFKNADRENDFTKAQNGRRAGIVTGGVAAGAFVGWLICKAQQKKKDKELERLSRSTGFLQFSPVDTPINVRLTSTIGVTYRF